MGIDGVNASQFLEHVLHRGVKNDRAIFFVGYSECLGKYGMQ